MRINTFLTFFIFLLLIGCRKDDINTTTTTPDPIVEDKYQIDINGLVVDENQDPIVNASILYDGTEVLTNEYGLFTINNVKVGNISGAFLNVESEYYYNGGVRVYANDLTEKFVKIELVRKEIAGFFTSNTGGEVAVANGGKITFAPNSISHDGISYSGKINVYAYYLDPSKDDFLSRSPGDLSAFDSNNDLVSLQSYGMMAVELVGENNEKLQISTDSKAEIIMPIPSALLSNAKNEIPLWHFNEDIGRWEEEGKAILEGSHYRGEVSHFSWWNCDDPFASSSLCVTVIQQRNNTPLENQQVILITDLFGIASDFTDENGLVCGLVPSDIVFTLQIKDLCGNIVYSQEIGPFTGMNNNITVEINDSNLDYYAISGIITNCVTSQPVQNAFIKVISNSGNAYSTTNENGEYYIEGVLCEMTDVSIVAIDPVVGLSGFGTIADIQDDSYELDIVLCEEAPFVTLTEDGAVIIASDFCEAKMKPNELLIYDENGITFLMGVEGVTGIGTYPASLLYSTNIAEASDLSVSISSFGSVGSVIKGTFEGENNWGNEINGSFVALRVE